MAKVQLDGADGVIEFEYTPPGGEKAAATVDVFQAHNTYSRLSQEHPDDSGALGEAWAEWLGGQGLIGLPHGVAFRVAEHVALQVAEFKKTRPANVTG